MSLRRRNRLRRRTPLRSRRHRRTAFDQAESQRFRNRVLAKAGYRCQVTGAEQTTGDGQLDAHHVITQQELRKRGLGSYRWDDRLGISVTKSVHRAHHSRREPIPVAVISAETVALIEQLGLGHYLERDYAPSA